MTSTRDESERPTENESTFHAEWQRKAVPCCFRGPSSLSLGYVFAVINIEQVKQFLARMNVELLVDVTNMCLRRSVGDQ